MAETAPALAEAIKQAEEARQMWRDSPRTGMAHVPQATRDDAARLYNALGSLIGAAKLTGEIERLALLHAENCPYFGNTFAPTKEPPDVRVP